MSDFQKEMQALQIDRYHEDPFLAIQNLHIVQTAIPKPSYGEVLIRVEAAPCNPSDLLFLQGRYGKKKTLPAIPGWEGAGTVVASGGGALAWWLIRKRVAFSVQSDKGGTWAQYCTVNVKHCIPLQNSVNIEQGACLIINPLTAVGLVDEARKGRHRAIIQNAAASQVGRMVLALAKKHEIPVIHIVRSREQELLLKNLGADIVLHSESDHFIKDLQEEALRLNATIAFDAVAGSITGELLKAMPPQSKILVYGALSGATCSGISPLDLIFKEKTVTGFFLSAWLAKKRAWELIHTTNLVQKMIRQGSLHNTIRKQVSLDEAPLALAAYQKEMTLGKILIKPQSSNR